MHIVLGATKPLRLEACSRSITLRSIMLFCSHLAVLRRQCFRPLWVRNYDCNKGISVPTRLTEGSFEKG